MNDQLIGFYRGTSPDRAGRTIDQIWAWTDSELELVHDYIQWLFPSAKPSQFNAKAPLLDEETVRAFRNDSELRARLLRSLERMLSFYGLELRLSAGCPPCISKAGNYSERRANWQEAPAGQLNHNLLRLTRILEALTVLGLEEYSAALCACLETIQSEEPDSIPEKTLSFWRQAATPR